MKAVAALLLVLALGVFSKTIDVQARQKFTDFMQKHNKVYESATEFQHRFNVFQDNLKKIEELNALKGSTHDITRFADMTLAEFRSYPCGVDRLSSLEGPAGNVSSTPTLSAPPASWDWTTQGAVTPVKDQGQCGSCWAFSTVGNLEGVWFLATKNLVSLSEQEFVDCSTTSYGCQGGWPFWAFTDILKGEQGQVDTESGYAYTAETGTCEFPQGSVGATYSKYTSYCTEDTAVCTEDNMAALLYQYGPLSACLDATPMQFYTGGVDNPTNCDPSAIDHCITIVGYGTDAASGDKFWKIKNSWGTSWGEAGYYRLIRGLGACGINKVITVATASK